ncbi:protein of unknown function [Cupriavidus taiwanensis]|uniref:Uncharacterized protein n=1 Tax=Cupriavidus taiwanensis TaxID=164546 RepID=A0A9Q7UVD9_9BURK|nr:protein of unknown function [Cupriavidus taiwanensis]
MTTRERGSALGKRISATNGISSAHGRRLIPVADPTDRGVLCGLQPARALARLEELR